MRAKIPYFQGIARGEKKKSMFYHIYISTSHLTPEKSISHREKNPWNDVGVGDERDIDEDCSV